MTQLFAAVQVNLGLNLQYEDTFNLIMTASWFIKTVEKYSNTTILMSSELKPLFVL